MCTSGNFPGAKWETGERPVRTRRCDHVVCAAAAMQPGATGAKSPGRLVTDVKWEPEDLHVTVKLFSGEVPDDCRISFTVPKTRCTFKYTFFVSENNDIDAVHRDPQAFLY